MRPGSPANCLAQQGFTLVWVLAALVAVSVGLAALGPLWAEQARRDREQDLLKIGHLYAQAIASYYAASPGMAKQYPPTLEALVTDLRYVGVRRHLRRLYADPVNPGQAWGLVRGADGGIRGVFSRSSARPLRTEALDMGVLALPKAERYDQWQFIPKVQP